MHAEHSDLLRDTPSDSEPLPATPSLQVGGTQELRAPPHQELRATQSQSELLQCFRAAPSYSEHSEHSELRCSPSCSELQKWEYHRSGKTQNDDAGERAGGQPRQCDGRGATKGRHCGTRCCGDTTATTTTRSGAGRRGGDDDAAGT